MSNYHCRSLIGRAIDHERIDEANFQGEFNACKAAENSQTNDPENTIVSSILTYPILRRKHGRGAVSSKPIFLQLDPEVVVLFIQLLTSKSLEVNSLTQMERRAPTNQARESRFAAADVVSRWPAAGFAGGGGETQFFAFDSIRGLVKRCNVPLSIQHTMATCVLVGGGGPGGVGVPGADEV